MEVSVTPKRVFVWLQAIILFLLFANVAGIISKYFFDHDYVFGLLDLFRFDEEMNVPTLYSSIALFVSAMLLLIISNLRKVLGRCYLDWFFLSLIFIFLSIDEISSIHERLIVPVRDALGTSGFLYYAWVIPYGALLIVFIASYSRFLVSLPRRIMILFVLSGTIYVSGAIGFELIGGFQADLNGTSNLTYSLITTVEELLEMAGIALFIYTLLSYISEQLGTLTINIVPGKS